MATCYEIFGVGSMERQVENGVPGPWKESDSVLHFSPEAESAFDSILAPFDMNTARWLWAEQVTRRKNRLPLPLAVIAFEKEYRLAGHFASIRTDRAALPFTCYSTKPGDLLPDVPPISLVYVTNWAALAETAVKSPFLADAWASLQATNLDRRWLCVPDPLPSEWVSAASRDDAQLFARVRNAQRLTQF